MPDRDTVSSTTRPRRIGRADLLVIVASAGLLAAFAILDPPDFDSRPDFAAMEVAERKQAFFDYLSPYIAQINQRFADDRDRVRTIREAFENGHTPSWSQRRWLARLADQLEVSLDDTALGETLATLECRAGIVPESLVLVQAALESGWGTSRFALEGNNYFGQRCYREGCGIAPQGHDDDAGFGLAAFSSPAASVESFVLNLNTHPNYEEFRALRQSRRDAGQPVTGLSLVQALEGYSERGADYVAEVAAMIRANGLE
ncbi:MAG: glucosaminidase domain-containing protein [Gammaproteobacteria bacterium]